LQKISSVSTALPKKPPLLIVDDDKAVARLLARVAERAGFDADVAKDGVQAVEMLDKKPYDIAIIDLMMPRMSGYDLVQKISTLQPRPVVLVATALMNGDVASLDDSMVRRVIKKPFDINAVAEALIETAREVAERRAATPLPSVTVIAGNATIIAKEANVVVPPPDETTPDDSAAPPPEKTK